MGEYRERADRIKLGDIAKQWIPGLIVTMVILILTSACSLTTTSPMDVAATWTLLPSNTSFGEVTLENEENPVPEASLTPSPPTNTPYPGMIGPFEFDKGVNPLTGLVVENPENLNRRPVSVKINNYPRSNRPQWGLSLADLVYEYYHNNELTRFHAIFYGNNANYVGPIRSGRMPDHFLVSTYQSNFLFASADSRILDFYRIQDYSDRLIYLLDGDCPPNPVCRYEPYTYNYLLGDTSKVGVYLGKEDSVNLKGMSFNAYLPSGSKTLDRLFINYSYSAYLYWEYDPASGRYFRFQDTQEDIGGSGKDYVPLRDRLTDTPIAADNVVVLMVEHYFEVYHPPSNGDPATEIINMNFSGTGTAYAMRDGEIFELQWVRPPEGSVVYLVFPDGTRYPFKPGTTWFQIITPESILDKDGIDWCFTFILDKPDRTIY
ncbi:MAG: DUF3048 domain-containing protein [Anaerolineales bacterium]|nr:DUF3048 domain-containing protein [Anaerolineales bacterium]